MYRSRVSFGSLAASTALICVLSLVPPAVSSDGGFFTLPLAQAQCCFTAKTPVLMADGAERPIARITPGDRVISRSGGVNRVTGIHTVPLGLRALFGNNQHPPFFTAEHPFLTPGGWRALDRAATRVETPGLKVAELAAGDVLIMATAVSGETAGALALAPAVSFGDQVLHRLTSARGNPDDRVFNLILGGDHSYVANGFVVHNKGGGGGGGEGGGQGTGPGNGQGNANRGIADVAGLAVAADRTPLDESTTSSEDSAPAGTTDDASAGSANADGSEFSGSSSPAGPDLSTSQEKDIISNGWQ